MASDPTLPPGPRGIPARLKLLERRIDELQQECRASAQQESEALAEARRMLALCLDGLKRITVVELDVAELKRRRRR